jgi:hypothetical protein
MPKQPRRTIRFDCLHSKIDDQSITNVMTTYRKVSQGPLTLQPAIPPTSPASPPPPRTMDRFPSNILHSLSNYIDYASNNGAYSHPQPHPLAFPTPKELGATIASSATESPAGDCSSLTLPQNLAYATYRLKKAQPHFTTSEYESECKSEFKSEFEIVKNAPQVPHLSLS